MSLLKFPPGYIPLEVQLEQHPKLKKSDLQMLKNWIEKQPHLPELDILILTFFLHRNYYHLEPTKRTIDNFYTIKTHTPELFSNRDPIGCKELRKAFTVSAIIPLELKTEERYMIIYVRLLDFDASKFNQNEFIKHFIMACEANVFRNVIPSGYVIILDALGISFGHIAQINLLTMKKFLFFVQEAIPIRLKAVHILNTISLVDTVLNMIKPFLKTELLNLLHFHLNVETLKKFVPIEALPNESGGKAGPIAEIAAKNVKLLEESRAYFQYDEAVYRVNESLRIGKFHDADSLFGLDGSFKKLEID